MHATISNEFLTDSLHFVKLFKSLQRCIIICIDGKHCVHVRKARRSGSYNVFGLNNILFDKSQDMLWKYIVGYNVFIISTTVI